MATVQNVIDGGAAYDSLNDSALLDDTELIGIIDRAQKELMARHPDRFRTKSAVIAPTGEPWVLPVHTKLHLLVKAVGGTRVHLVDLDDQAASFPPAGYLLGGTKFYSTIDTTTATLNPATDSLVAFHGIVPTTLTATGNSLDAEWPEWWTRILELEVALFLAIKDGRPTAAVVKAELDEKKRQFDVEMSMGHTLEEHRYAE